MWTSLEWDPTAPWHTSLSASEAKPRLQVFQLSQCHQPGRREQRAFAMVDKQGGLCRLLLGPVAWSKTLAWLSSPFSVPLNRAERAQHFLENPEPLVHISPAALFVEGTIQFQTTLSCSSSLFCLLSQVWLPSSSQEESMCWYYLRSRCNTSSCSPHQATSRHCHVPPHSCYPCFPLRPAGLLAPEASPISQLACVLLSPCPYTLHPVSLQVFTGFQR